MTYLDDRIHLQHHNPLTNKSGTLVEMREQSWQRMLPINYLLVIEGRGWVLHDDVYLYWK